MEAQHAIALKDGKLMISAQAVQGAYVQANLVVEVSVVAILEKLATDSSNKLDDAALPWVKAILASLEKPAA